MHWGNIFALSGEVSCCDVGFVKCKQKVVSPSRKVVFIRDKNYLVTEISPMSKRDLGTRENVSSRMNAMQLFILFHNKASLAYRLAEMFISVTEITSAHMNRP